MNQINKERLKKLHIKYKYDNDKWIDKYKEMKDEDNENKEGE